MRINPKCFVFLLLLITKAGVSQETNQQQFLFEGKIHTNTNVPIPSVNVYLNNEVGMVTNIDGYFHIKIALGDTVNFSYIGYQQKSIIIDTISLIKHFFILKKDTVTLPNYEVISFMNFHDFKKSFIGLNTDNTTLINAKNNIKLILLQAKNNTGIVSTNEDFQKQSIQQQTDLLIYRHQIHPQNTIDAVKIINELSKILNKKNE